MKTIKLKIKGDFMTTLKDVAMLSNCSVATVCKVFKNSAEISEDTKQKVLKAARQCGYLKKATTKTAVFGGMKIVVFCDPACSFITRFTEISNYFKKNGYAVVYTVLNPRDARDLLAQTGAVGMIFVGENAFEELNIFKFVGAEISALQEIITQLNALRPQRAPRKTVAAPNSAPSKEVKSASNKPEDLPRKKDEIWLL